MGSRESTRQKMTGGTLKVHLHKINNLADGDWIGKSDPYVRFELEQDNLFFDKDFGEKKSSTKKDEQNPVYEETFTFADLPGLNNMELTVKVMDDDMLSDDKIGKCKIKLEDIRFIPGIPYSSSWVVDKNFFSANAEIYLSLTWFP